MNIKIIPIIIIFFFCSGLHTAEASVFGSSLTGLTSGLIGWWTFDGKDIPNGRINDVSGNGNYGTVSSISTSTFYAPGKLGQAAEFDGTDDLVTFPGMTPPTTSFTISLWVYPVPGSQNYASIFSQGYDKALFLRGGFNRFTYYEFDENMNDSTLPNYQWSHYVLVSTGSGVTHYLNGVPDGSQVVNITPVTFTNMGNDVGSETFRGRLDDVRLYNRALSASEVKQLYAMGGSKTSVPHALSAVTGCAKGLSCGLVGWWTFDGKDIPNGRINDVSGNGNYGTVSSISTSTFYALGKLGQGLKFDGVDDKVVISGSTVHNTYQTVSMWVKMNDTSADQTVAYVSHQCGANNLIAYDYQSSNSGRFVFTTCTSGPDISAATAGNSIRQGEWHHVVGTIGDNGSNMDIKIYLDGVYANVSSTVLTNIRWWQADGSVIGANVGSVGFSNATIDDVRLYDRALSASEIKQLYSTGGSKVGGSQPIGAGGCTTGLTCKLVAWWTFNGKDVSYRTVRDISGSGNNATTVNVATSTFFTRGKIGQGVTYDGVNDSLSMSGPTVDTNFAVSMWIRPRSVAIPYQNLIAEGFDSGIYLSNNRINFFDQISSLDNLSTTALIADRWYHVVVTCASTICTHYLNSVANGSFNFTSPVTFLNMGNDGSGEVFRGDMDDVRVYNRTLGVSEIKALYNAGK